MQTPNLVIREAVPRDVPSLVELAANAFRDTYRGIDDPQEIEDYISAKLTAAHFLAHVQTKASTLLVAERATALVGYALLTKSAPPPCVEEPEAIELARLYLRQDLKGQGIGQELMKSVHEAAARLGARVVWLGVYDRNLPARAFYRRCGFEEVGTTEFVLGGRTYNDPVMCCAIVDES